MKGVKGGRAEGRKGGRAEGRKGGRAEGRRAEGQDGRTDGRTGGRTDGREGSNFTGVVYQACILISDPLLYKHLIQNNLHSDAIPGARSASFRRQQPQAASETGPRRSRVPEQGDVERVQGDDHVRVETGGSPTLDTDPPGHPLVRSVRQAELSGHEPSGSIN